jgi:hypothetical protein
MCMPASCRANAFGLPFFLFPGEKNAINQNTHVSKHFFRSRIFISYKKYIPDPVDAQRHCRQQNIRVCLEPPGFLLNWFMKTDVVLNIPVYVLVYRNWIIVS